MSNRVASNITNVPGRAMLNNFDSSGHYTTVTLNQANAIGVDAPSAFGNANGGPGYLKADQSANSAIAMGVAGSDCNVGVYSDTAATIILWVWVGSMKKWALMGATTTISQKAYQAGAVDGFILAEGSLYYLQASVPIANAAIGGLNLKNGINYDVNPIIR